MELIFGLEEIHQAAMQFLKYTPGHQVFAFTGEMGSGKTTFIHALCEVLGVKESVSSPTFSIINEYLAEKGETIYHMDLYRIRNENEAMRAGIADCLFSGKVCMVEWPEKIPGLLPGETLHITLTVKDTNTRKLQINL